MKELIEKIKKYATTLTKAGVSVPKVPGLSASISANVGKPTGAPQMKTEKQNLGGIPNPVESRSQ